MPRRVFTCELCGDVVDPKAPSTNERVTGWAVGRHRAGGGVHGVSLPEWHGVYAHRVCVEHKRKNITLRQGQLF